MCSNHNPEKGPSQGLFGQHKKNTMLSYALFVLYCLMTVFFVVVACLSFLFLKFLSELSFQFFVLFFLVERQGESRERVKENTKLGG